MIWWTTLYAVYCGVLWRLRGGALSRLTGYDFGTDGARLFCGCLMATPLATVTDWRVMLLFPAIAVGTMLTGWGPFQGMGRENVPGYAPEASWMRALPEVLGLKPGGYWHDFLGMMQAGILCVLPAVLVAAWIAHLSALLVLAAGAAFPLAYTVSLLKLPALPRFAAGQEWGEVFAGAAFGAALGLVLL